MTRLLLGFVLAFGYLSVSEASADIIIVTYTGTVNYLMNVTGVFGSVSLAQESPHMLRLEKA